MVNFASVGVLVLALVAGSWVWRDAERVGLARPFAVLMGYGAFASFPLGPILYLYAIQQRGNGAPKEDNSARDNGRLD